MFRRYIAWCVCCLRKRQRRELWQNEQARQDELAKEEVYRLLVRRLRGTLATLSIGFHWRGGLCVAVGSLLAEEASAYPKQKRGPGNFFRLIYSISSCHPGATQPRTIQRHELERFRKTQAENVRRSRLQTNLYSVFGTRTVVAHRLNGMNGKILARASGGG